MIEYNADVNNISVISKDENITIVMDTNSKENYEITLDNMMCMKLSLTIIGMLFYKVKYGGNRKLLDDMHNLFVEYLDEICIKPLEYENIIH